MHVDDTVKYAVNPELLPTKAGAQSFIDSHKARADAKQKSRAGYWDNNVPTW